jgi:hypothetical protein
MPYQFDLVDIHEIIGQNVLSQVPDDHIWDENLFQEALCTFAINYCSSMACQEEKRFMKRHLGLPSSQLATTLQSRIQQFNPYLPYLSGIRKNLMLMTSKKWSIIPYLLTYILQLQHLIVNGKIKIN